MWSYFWVKISVVAVFCDNRLWVTLLRSALLSSDQLGVPFVAFVAADWEAAEYLLRETMKHPYFNLIYQPTPPYQQMTNIFLSKKETGSTMLKILNHSKCRFQNVICRLMHCSKAVKYTSWCKLQLELPRLTVTVPPNIANMVIKYLCRDQLSKLALPSNNEKKNCPCVSQHRGYEYSYTDI